jgi:uncharacterized protein (TIGR02996 family)
MSPEEQESPFIHAVTADPESDVPRLIYADWLEEQGDPRGEYLRLECYLATLGQEDPQFDPVVVRFRELHSEIDPDWRATVARSKVERCRLFEFRCPKRWDKLRRTADSTVRFCTACRKEVFYCDSILEAREHAERGQCVALDVAVPRREGDLEDEAQLDGLLMGDFGGDELMEPEGPNPRPSLSPVRRRPWWRFW